MKKIAVILTVLLALTAVFAYITYNRDKDKAPPVAGKFNNYIARLAESSQQLNKLQNQMNQNWTRMSITEKQNLLDKTVIEIGKVKKQVQDTEPPVELTDLKGLYLNMYNTLEENVQMQKKQLMPSKAPDSPDADEEEELQSSKTMVAYGQIDAYLNSLQQVYEVKCLDKSAAINLVKINGNKYFADK